MAEPNIQQIEESFRKAQRRSWLRFTIFMVVIIGLWVATYIITEGKFSLVRTETIREVETKVIVPQDSQIISKDSSIAALRRINRSLEDEVKGFKEKLAAKGVTVERTPDRTAELAKLKDKLRKQEEAQRYQDSIIRSRKQQYEQSIIQQKNIYNQDMRQQQMTK